MLILKKGIKVYDEIIELQLLKHHIIEQKSLLPSCQNSKKKQIKSNCKASEHRYGSSIEIHEQQWPKSSATPVTMQIEK